MQYALLILLVRLMNDASGEEFPSYHGNDLNKRFYLSNLVYHIVRYYVLFKTYLCIF